MFDSVLEVHDLETAQTQFTCGVCTKYTTFLSDTDIETAPLNGSVKESERRPQRAPRHGMAIDTRLLSVSEVIAAIPELRDQTTRNETR